MVDLQTEPITELTPEQQEFLVKLDMDILKAKNFLKRCGYVTLTEQEYKHKVIAGIILGMSPGLLLGFALCKLIGG